MRLVGQITQLRRRSATSVPSSGSQGGLQLEVLPLWVRIGFWTCTAIAVAAVIRRVIALVHPTQSGPPAVATLDKLFASHASLTFAHILPALAFVVAAPLFVLSHSGKKAWLDYLLFSLGIVVGITAYAMSAYSIGGWVERSAVLFFNTLFLLSIVRAYLYMRSDAQFLKRRWLLRAIAILLGIATTRPVVGVFFATSRLTHLQPNQFFGIAFWIGFSVNTVLAEFWLHRGSTRNQR